MDSLFTYFRGIRSLMADPHKIYTVLKEIFFLLDDGDRRLFDTFNLTSTRFYALVHLGEQPGMSLSELSSLLLCDKSNATRIFKGLESEGLVFRRPHETDGRTVRLYLSNTGATLLRKVISAHQEFNEKRFEDLEIGESEELLNDLLVLKHNLRDHLDDQVLLLK